VDCRTSVGGISPGLIIGIVVPLVLVFAAVAAFLWWKGKRGQRNNSAAPKDQRKPFVVLFTDIQASTHLWATIPEIMAESLDVHHFLIRKLIQKYKMYEVKTIGDSFMCVCMQPSTAVKFAIGLQHAFQHFDWGSDAINEAYATQLEKEMDPAVWNGLRVRIGMHYGYGDIKLDPTTKGYDYYGTVVNTAARIESVCHGGQIGISQAMLEELDTHSLDLVWMDLGEQELRGLSEKIHLYQLLPKGAMEMRMFPPLRLDKAQELQLEEDNKDGSPRRASKAGSVISSRGGYAPEKDDLALWAECHHLVSSGVMSAEELWHNYQVGLTTMNTILSSQPPKDKAQMVESLCTRLHVRYYGDKGAKLKKSLHGLIDRVLPATGPHLLQPLHKELERRMSRNSDC
jgi:adenylate cyclase